MNCETPVTHTRARAHTQLSTGYTVLPQPAELIIYRLKSYLYTSTVMAHIQNIMIIIIIAFINPA